MTEGFTARSFETVYRHDPDPWSQSAHDGDKKGYYEFSRRRLVETLRPYRMRTGLEVGCGHGHVTAMLEDRLGVVMTGMDISKTAINRAQELHPQRFVVGNIIDNDFTIPDKFSCVLWGQVFWYFLHEIDRAIENTLRCVEAGGLLVISQMFRDDQRYDEKVEGFAGVLDIFLGYCERLRLIEARYDDSERYKHKDGLLFFRAL